MTAELREIIFLDIETVSAAASYEELDERIKSHWARKASFFKRDATQSLTDPLYDRAGIYAEFGKIICIGVGKFMEDEQGRLVLRTKAYFGSDEKALLLEFKSMVEKFDPNVLKFCAHNGKEFDYPYICRRMLINCIPLPQTLNLSGKKAWEIPHLDTMELWKFGDFKHYTSLDLLAAIFDVPTSKEEMEGNQVNEVYYKENDLEKIKSYCLRDVVVLAQLFLKLRCISLPDLIIHESV